MSDQDKQGEFHHKKTQKFPRPQIDNQGAKTLGNYTLREKLNQGGSGSVYRAVDKNTGREVAVKVLKQLFETGSSTAHEMEKRFVREVKALQQLRHGNIVRFIEFGMDRVSDKMFYAMELGPGQSLEEILKSQGKLDFVRGIQTMYQIAKAVEYAHELGIIHRDLKSANIYITQDGKPLILDFGLAKLLQGGADVGKLTQTGQILGSFVYMSPEQLEANPSDIAPPTDIYSLGVLLFELLTGTAPFRGIPMEIMKDKLSGKVPKIRQVNSQIPPKVEEICSKAMDANPQRRPTAAEFSREVFSVLEERDLAQWAFDILEKQKKELVEDTYLSDILPVLLKRWKT